MGYEAMIPMLRAKRNARMQKTISGSSAAKQ